MRRASAVARTGLGPELGVPARTVSRILRRHGCPYLRECDPLTGEVIRASKTTAVRYERDHPGELVHVDVKKIGQIPDGGGWQAHGRQMGSPPAPRSSPDRLRLRATRCVDDHSRLAYSEILPDEKGPTCAAFMLRAARTSLPMASPQSTGAHRQPLVLSPVHRRARRNRPRSAPSTSSSSRTVPGRTARSRGSNRTLQVEWAYRRAFLTNADRSAALAPSARALQHSPVATPHLVDSPPDQPVVTNLMAEYSSDRGTRRGRRCGPARRSRPG